MENIPLPLAISLLASTAASYMTKEQLAIAVIAFRQMSDNFATILQLRALCTTEISNEDKDTDAEKT